MTAAISNPQETDSGTAPPHDDALNRSTSLVTITVGGNDLGFPASELYRAALAPGGALLLHRESTWQQHYIPNGHDSVRQDPDLTVAPAVARALADVKHKAPNAKIVVDYPAISTDRATAPDPQTYPVSCFFSPIVRPNSFPAAATALPRSSAAPESLHRNLAGATAIADIITPIARTAQTTPASDADEQAEPGRFDAVIALGISVVLFILSTAALWFARRRRTRRWRAEADRLNLALQFGPSTPSLSNDQVVFDARTTRTGRRNNARARRNLNGRQSRRCPS